MNKNTQYERLQQQKLDKEILEQFGLHAKLYSRRHGTVKTPFLSRLIRSIARLQLRVIWDSSGD